MGQPVVHFEVIGRNGDKLRSYYSELFGWKIDADNEMHYGVIQREGNTNADGIGIGGGVGGPGPDDYPGHIIASFPSALERASISSRNASSLSLGLIR
jgi:uncharacterized protein